MVIYFSREDGGGGEAEGEREFQAGSMPGTVPDDGLDL